MKGKMGQKNLTLEKTLGEEQFRAIFLARKRGKELARQHPEIADDYRKGMIRRKLAQKYGNYTGYDISESVADTIVHFALQELLTRREQRQYGKRHERQGGRKGGVIVGRRAYEEGIGIWGMSEEEKRGASRKGGRVAGRKNYEEGIGIWGMSEEELHETRKKAMYTMGQIPYDNEERETEFGRMNEKSYIIHLRETGRYTWTEISQKLEDVYGTKRMSGTLRVKYYKWKKLIVT